MEISFSDDGEGFPLVLLPGFCETRKIWDDFVPELSKGFRVLTPDLPGFGKSPLPGDMFSLEEIAAGIFEWLNQLEIKETKIIGHSMGGYITLALAKLHPEILKGFCLFHSTAYADSEEKKATRRKLIEFVTKQGVGLFATSFVPQLFYPNNRKALSAKIDQLIYMTAGTKKKAVIAYTHAMRERSDRADVLKTFNGPILFIAGDNDTSAPLKDVESQALLAKHGILHVLENTGHMGMFESKTSSLKAVADFARFCEKL